MKRLILSIAAVAAVAAPMAFTATSAAADDDLFRPEGQEITVGIGNAAGGKGGERGDQVVI